MARPNGGSRRSPDFAWFVDVMVDESVWQEEEATEEDVETLLSKLLDEAGSVFQIYVEDDLNGSRANTERACARVANRALAVALFVREERYDEYSR